MAKKAFRLQLPERGTLAVSIAEFTLVKVSDANAMARRARVLGALASLAEKERNQFAKAVAEACRLFLGAGLSAGVRFGVGELDRQTLIEVVIATAETVEGAAIGSSAIEKLNRLAEGLFRFEYRHDQDQAPHIVLAQAAPAMLAVKQADILLWSELLAAKTLEDAIAIAQHGREASNAALGIARSRGPTPEATERATADREDLETLSLVVSRATNAITIMDANGVIQWANEAFTKQTGYAAAQVIGQQLGELLFGPSTKESAIRAFQQSLRNGHEMIDDVLLYRQDGRTFWGECKLIPVHDESGHLSRWIAIQSDVTRRRQTEEALRAAKQAAETSSRSKSEFLANMSHEIRTPLNAILGMTELALTTDLNSEQRDYLKTVQSSADTLLHLLNDVLDVSKIEAGRMEIEDINFNLAEVVRETLKALAVKAHEKGLELAVHMAMDIPQYLRGDPTRIRQVLFNLVGNAIKFTEQGEVVVEVEQQWQTVESVCLHFSIRDTGIGIPQGRLQKIFDSFTQVDSSMARRFGGTGLGLTITSQLLRMMNGKIWVQSEEGEGSTFHFTVQLKLGEAPPSATPTADASVLAGKHALIVDDNATNRRILQQLLLHWGMKPTQCDSAASALQTIESAAKNRTRFDLVLLDAMMPVTDGFRLAELMKQRRDLECGTVMMLSSADRPNSAARCRELGIDTSLVKPVSASALLEAVLAALSDSPKQSEDDLDSPMLAEFVQSPKPIRSLRVLVVDDHKPNRKLAIRILERRGHKCESACDGEEAVAAFTSSSFDLVLMDVQMPETDGLEASRAIRARERSTGAHVPIIAMTAHAMTGDRERCLSAGMDGYLSKPIRARELLEKLAMTVGPAPPALQLEPQEQPATVVDWPSALRNVGNEQELLVEVTQVLIGELTPMMNLVREAADREDADSLARAVHPLKGSLMFLGETQAGQTAEEIEELAREGDLANLRQLFVGLEKQVERLRVELTEYAARSTQNLR